MWVGGKSPGTERMLCKDLPPWAQSSLEWHSRDAEEREHCGGRGVGCQPGATISHLSPLALSPAASTWSTHVPTRTHTHTCPWGSLLLESYDSLIIGLVCWPDCSISLSLPLNHEPRPRYLLMFLSLLNHHWLSSSHVPDIGKRRGRTWRSQPSWMEEAGCGGGCIKFSTSRAKEERAEETQIPTTVDTPAHLAGPVTSRESGYD